MNIKQLKALCQIADKEDGYKELDGILISKDTAVATDKYVLLYIEFPYEIEPDYWIPKEVVLKQKKDYIDFKENKIIFKEVEIENNQEMIEKFPKWKDLIVKYSNYSHSITLNVRKLEKIIKAARKLNASKITFYFNIENNEVKDEPLKFELKSFQETIAKGYMQPIKEAKRGEK